MDGAVDLPLDGEMRLDDDEVDGAANEAIAQAKQPVPRELQTGARKYAEQLKQHINNAKEQAARNQAEVTRDAKK